MSKSALRLELKTIRAAIAPARREEAGQALLLHLLPTLLASEHVLSFASFGHEIDTSLVNLYLARTGRLLLPKMVGETLHIFLVSNPLSHLIPHQSGLFEPNPKWCPQVDPAIIQIALIPALGFDTNNHRLGYGRGFYDRFLKQIPHVHTIGIGFKEQFVPHLPSDENDFPLEKVSLF